MPAKLVLAAVALTIVLSITAIALFWWFRERDRMAHERRMAQEEHRHEETAAAWQGDDEL